MNFLSNLENNIKSFFGVTEIVNLNQLPCPKEITALIIERLPTKDQVTMSATSKDLQKITREAHPEFALINAAVTSIKDFILGKSRGSFSDFSDNKLTFGLFMLRPLKVNDLVNYELVRDRDIVFSMPFFTMSELMQLTLKTDKDSSQKADLLFNNALKEQNIINIWYELDAVNKPILTCRDPITKETNKDLQARIDEAFNPPKKSEN